MSPREAATSPNPEQALERVRSHFEAAAPLVGALFVSGSDLETQVGLWRSVRLGLLWGGTTYGSNLIVNALLLKWLIRFLDSNEYDFSERNEPVHAPPSSATED